jgi:hypothetical protein
MTSQLAFVYLAARSAKPTAARLGEALENLFYRYGWNAGLDDSAFGKASRILRAKEEIEEFLAMASPLRATRQSPDANLTTEEVIALAGPRTRSSTAAASTTRHSRASRAPEQPRFLEQHRRAPRDDLLENTCVSITRVCAVRLWGVIARADRAGQQVQGHANQLDPSSSVHWRSPPRH